MHGDMCRIATLGGKSLPGKNRESSYKGKDVIFGSSRVVLPLNRALYITSIGWVKSLNLGVVLVSLSLSPLTG